MKILVFHGVNSLLERNAARPAYPAVVGLITFAATLSMTIPVVPIITTAALLGRRRWLATALLGALGSGIGALLLYLMFHHLGWAQLAERHPELTNSAAWARASAWIARYGLVALLAISASPLPQTPALAVVAIARMSPVDVLVVLFAGKLVKYGVMAWLATRFRGWVLLRNGAGPAPDAFHADDQAVAGQPIVAGLRNRRLQNAKEKRP